MDKEYINLVCIKYNTENGMLLNSHKFAMVDYRKRGNGVMKKEHFLTI